MGRGEGEDERCKHTPRLLPGNSKPHCPCQASTVRFQSPRTAARMRIWLWSHGVETSLVLPKVLTLLLSLDNLTSRGQGEGVAFNSLDEELEVTTYWWGEWAKWTACTRTCGGGVKSQERHCLKQRKRTTVGKYNTTCNGNAKQYVLCNIEECPSSGRSFREEQCGSFNSQPYNGRNYRWKPLYPDDYVHISSNPCDLHCTTLNGQRQLMVPARDGTSCQYGDYRGVCVDGHCEPIGCDGVLFSANTVDKCGVCQGDGSSCRRVTGNFGRGASGYAFITKIPEGSWDIQIIERKKSADILAVTDQAGNFFFNGAYKVDTPQNFPAAGTIFKYRRPMDMHETGIEYIVAKGPINQAVNVLVWNRNGQTPRITYEYTVLRGPLSPASHPPLYPGLEKGCGHASIESLLAHARGVSERTAFDLKQTRALEPQSSADAPGERMGRVTNEVYETPQTPSHSTAVQPSERKTNSENLIWSVWPGKRMSSDGLNVNISTNQLFTHGDELHSTEVAPLEQGYSSLKHRNDSRHNGSLQEFTGDLLFPNRTLLPGFQGANRTNQTRNQQKFWPKNFKLSAADMYRWKLSSQEPCSMTCSIGLARSFITCVRYDGAEVDDRHCETQARPEPVHDICIGRECQPRWEMSSWSECSRTCGEGIQFRRVRCWKMLSPGLDSSVYSDLCTLAELERPLDRRTCKSPTCGPQWEVAQWSECPAKCGQQAQVTREVRCSYAEKSCDVSNRPPSIKNCTGPPCERQWTSSEWEPCSGPCGQGKMVRHVYCKIPDGRLVPETQCSAESKPLAIHPCGGMDCAPQWLEQDWERCNTTCGRGVRKRIVLCAGISGGQFKVHEDSQCAAEDRPEDESTCFERPCFKWYTTPWSECTKTCGVGTRTRDVKCYQGLEIVRGCDPLTKPVNKQTCPMEPCPTEPPDENCKDQPNTNCSLALRVNLCSHWYYSKACCHSCRTTFSP